MTITDNRMKNTPLFHRFIQVAVGRKWPKAISDETCRQFPTYTTADLHLIRKPKHFAARGFTLLEVMVALTITGMALGGLFGVIAGNKRLAWRSEESLVTTMQARSMINFSQLNDERGEVFVNFENDELVIDTGYEIAPPERKTVGSTLALRQYEVIDEVGEVITTGTYWVELDLPE